MAAMGNRLESGWVGWSLYDAKSSYRPNLSEKSWVQGVLGVPGAEARIYKVRKLEFLLFLEDINKQ